MARIAYLGGGNMAQGMIGRLLGAGHQVAIYNRTRAKVEPFAAQGATIASSPREAVAGAEIVFSSVTNDEASRAVWLGPEGALHEDLGRDVIVVEHSTLSYDWVKTLSARAREMGLRYVDCPVAGRPDAAAKGQLIVFGGAAPEDLETIRPHIEPISRKIFHMGAPGAGTAFKLIYNLMGVAQIVALAEGLAAAEAAGIDIELAAEAFAAGNTGSPHVLKHGPFMARNEHEDPPAFTANNRVKDSRYAVELEEALGQEPRVGRAALAAFQFMVDSGHGAAADSKIMDAIRGRL